MSKIKYQGIPCIECLVKKANESFLDKIGY